MGGVCTGGLNTYCTSPECLEGYVRNREGPSHPSRHHKDVQWMFNPPVHTLPFAVVFY